MIADVLDNSVCIFGQPVRDIAEDQVARGLQPSIPARISLDGKVMRRAVDFDYNPRFQAREVDEERTDWHLSPACDRRVGADAGATRASIPGRSCHAEAVWR